MSENQNETTEGIDDDQLPDDLQPGEDNPLAEPLPDDVDTDALDMEGGKGPEESSTEESSTEGSSTEESGTGESSDEDHDD